jgi:hypothetical protein
MSSFFSPYRGLPIFVGILMMAVIAGCSSNPQITDAQIRGTITYKGNPLPGGEIRLFSKADPNKSQSGTIKADGSYEVLNAPLGEVMVLIDTEPIKSHPSLMMAKAGPNAPVELKGAGGQLKYVPIHKKYRDASATPLSTKVDKGDNRADFTVE